MSDTWVVNASPVIALAKVNRLHLLGDLCQDVIIPAAVVEEILAGPSSDPARQAVQRGFCQVVALDHVIPELLEWGLGRGETAVLALAQERVATAVIDDAAARSCAKALGIKVIGSLGVVLRAKKKAQIASAADVLRALRAAGLHLDDETVCSALKGIGEAWE